MYRLVNWVYIMNSSAIQLKKDIDLEKLPTIPHTLIKLIDIFQDVDADFTQICDIIQKDQVLTTKILTVANSASYAQCTFRDFEQLLVVLGMDTIKTIVTTTAVELFFSQFNSDSKGHMGNFWLVSLNAAFFAKEIAKLIGYPNLDEAYLGGLIHQIGQLIFYSQHYQEYVQLIDENKITFNLYEKEIELFGLSSAELGSKLISSWNMKSMLNDAILYQDAAIDDLFDTPLLIRIINLAHKFSLRFRNLEQNKDSDKLLFIEQSYQLFGLTQAVIEDVFSNVQTDVKNAVKSLGVKLDSDSVQINNNELYILLLAARVKNIAISASSQGNEIQENKPKQIISNLMQNIHIIFGLSRCLYFSYEKKQQKLICSAENISTTVDLKELNIQTDPPRSILAKAFNKKSITSSFENKSITAAGIVDRYIIRLLKTDGMICLPLFNKDSFFGVLTIGVNDDRYPGLLEQRMLLGEFTHTAVKNLSQFQIQQQNLEQANEEQNLHIRKMIHEANHPLTIITNYLHILSIKIRDGDHNIGLQIETLQQEVERVSDILLRMREHPGKSNNIMKNTNITLLIKELLSVLRSSLFHTYRIVDVLRLDESIPTIQCDSNGLKQVIINLVKNAVEAMPDGGMIEIETNDLVIVNDQKYIELSIFDAGSGMNEEVLRNLFKPVKTTKGKNHSGLGLSICKNIIDKLGGRINFHKLPHGGSKFTILLPRIIAKEGSSHGNK